MRVLYFAPPLYNMTQVPMKYERLLSVQLQSEDCSGQHDASLLAYIWEQVINEIPYFDDNYTNYIAFAKVM